MNKRMDSVRRLFAFLLIMLLVVPAIGARVHAKETFVMDKVLGATQKDVMVNGNRRVVYCMQYDYLWPITGSDYNSPQTPYWDETDASKLLLKDEEQLKTIERVLFAGYPYNSVGALNPLYANPYSGGDDAAADLTQALIWELMSSWGVTGNTHYDPSKGDDVQSIEGWAESYTSLKNYALDKNNVIPEMPNGFQPAVIGNTRLVAGNDGGYVSGALSISNPDGFVVTYQVKTPDGVVILNEDGKELWPEWDFADGQWLNMGCRIAGGEDFYLYAEDVNNAAGKDIVIDGAIKLPTDVRQYSTDATGKGDKGDGQGYVQHRFQTMLSVGLNVTEYHAEVKIEDKFKPVELAIEGRKFLKDMNGDTMPLADSTKHYDYHDKFSFTIFGDNGDEPLPLNTTVNNLEIDGIAPADIISFGNITFTTTGVYNYTIEENQVMEPNVSRDMSHWHLVVTVDEGENGQLTAVPEYTHHHDDTHAPSDGCTHAPLTFENTFSHTEIDKEIHISKVVSNDAGDGHLSKAGFKFSVYPAATGEDLNKYPVFKNTNGSQDVVITTGVSGEAFSPVLEFTESWFNSYSSNDKVELLYNIKEVDDRAPGYTYDKREAQAKIAITKTPGGQGEDGTVYENGYSAEIDYGFVNEDGTVDFSTKPVEFKNIYEAKGTLELAVTKVFKEADYAPEDGETYSFKINSHNTEGFELTADMVTLVYGEGKWTAKDSSNVITFTKTGEYLFELKEIDEGREGMTYDPNGWVVDVKVSDNGDGTLKTAAVYFREYSTSTGEDAAVFVNSYTAEVSTSLKFKKALEGKEWQNEEFVATINHSEFSGTSEEELRFDPCDTSAENEIYHLNIEHPVEVVFSKDAAEQNAEGIIFRAPGTYYLIIKESVPEETGNIVYDKTEYVVRYAIERDGNDLKIADRKVYDVTDGWAKRKELDSEIIEFANTVKKNDKDRNPDKGPYVVPNTSCR